MSAERLPTTAAGDGRRAGFRAPALPRLARRSSLVVLPLLLGACEWFTDFKRQPHIYPWESTSDTVPPRGAPQYSVPITGTQLAGFQVSYQPLPGTIDSIGRLVTNPTPVSDSSLANGRRYYSINCAVCHGDQGQGNGPATKYGMVGINLLTDLTKNRSDGYIYGMMRNGRGLMPTYNRIEEMDRWDVVNYVRGLQGRLPGRPVVVGQSQVPVGPVGRPGETGATLPGYTRLGPTRPVPYYKPRRNALGQERNLFGDPAPGNDVAAPPAAPGTRVVPDTTARVQNRDTVAGSTRPNGRTSAPNTSRPPSTMTDSTSSARRQP